MVRNVVFSLFSLQIRAISDTLLDRVLGPGPVVSTNTANIVFSEENEFLTFQWLTQNELFELALCFNVRNLALHIHLASVCKILFILHEQGRTWG